MRLRRHHLAALLAATFPFVQSEATSWGDADLGDAGRNVVLITWDGVRPNELARRDVLPFLWDELAPKGRVYDRMVVANTTFMSLPGYQSLLSGSPQPCFGNECGRIRSETLAERIVRSFGVERRRAATIASWGKLALAAERNAGATFVNAGIEPLDDDGADPEVRALNEAQARDVPPWTGARYDTYTKRHALRFLATHRPRFLHVGLNDSDEWGHRDEYERHLDALSGYDTWLKDLVKALADMGDYGRKTCLVITTDHGRGSGTKWSKHSNGVPESALVWMYAGCPLDDTAPSFRTPIGGVATHLDVRPTIERLLGLEPRPCLACGGALVD